MPKHWRPWENPDQNVISKYLKIYEGTNQTLEDLQGQQINSGKFEHCKECNKVFTRKDNLTRHIKLCHAEDRRLNCKHCLKPLSRLDALQRHEIKCSKKVGKLDKMRIEGFQRGLENFKLFGESKINDAALIQEITVGNKLNLHIVGNNGLPAKKIWNGMNPHGDAVKLLHASTFYITTQFASDVLKDTIRKHNTITMEFNKEFVKLAEYLLAKGGILTCSNGKSPWELEATGKNMQNLADATHFDEKFVQELTKRGIVVEETLHGQPLELYNAFAKQKYSFERVCVSLICCDQINPFLLLKQCLKSDMQISFKFTTPPNKLLGLLHNKKELLCLISLYNKLTIKRLEDTVDSDLVVVQNIELGNQLKVANLIVYICTSPTQSIITQLASLKKQVVCVCTEVPENLNKFSVIKDEIGWEDLSVNYQSKLMSQMRVVIHGNQNKFSDVFDCTKLRNELLVAFIRYNVAEFLESKIEKEFTSSEYLLPTIFDYFLPVKVVFQGITKNELQKFIKYGHNIVEIDEDIENSDCIIITKRHQFDKICKASASILIELHQGRFRLVQYAGGDFGIQRLLQTERTPRPPECEAFPFCACGNHPVGSGNLIWDVFRFPEQNLTFKVNLLNVIAKIKNSHWSEEAKLYKPKCSVSSAVKCWHISESFPEFHYKKDVIFSQLIKSNVGCSGLQQIALNTLFPRLVKRVFGTSDIMKKYALLGIVEFKGDMVVFSHESLAWYFIAEMVFENKMVQFTSASELYIEIFRDCFETQQVQVSYEWWNNTSYCSEPFQSFRFANSTLFKCIEAFLCKQQNGTISYHLKQNLNDGFAVKWIHACVHSNLLNLLKMLITVGVQNSVFSSKKIIILAVKYAEVPIINLVTYYYLQETPIPVPDLQVKLIWSKRNDVNTTLSILHVAALRGNFSVMEYLLNSHGFKDMLNRNHMWNVLSFCVRDTRKYDTQIEERKRIIAALLQLHANFVHETAEDGSTQLFAANIHIDLILYLVNLGVDVNANDKNCNNILHLYPEYMTPQEYDKLVRKLHVIGNDKLFHSQNKWQSTPLHRAVQYLEILDSTLELFSTAKVDFNAYTEKKNTVLTLSVIYQRSARLLDSLLRAGADINKQGKLNRSVLHYAAEYGNLTALRYLILHGCDVNATDEYYHTPLHLAFWHTNPHAYEIVHSLIRHGADLNAMNNFKNTPLFYALERNKHGERQERIIQLLKKAGARI